VSQQASQHASYSAPLPQLERGISVAPIRNLDLARVLVARPASKPLSQRLVYAAAIILCVFAIGQCLRATCTHLVKLQSLMQTSGAIHSSATQEHTTNLSLKDQMALYQSSRGVEILARERLNLVGPNVFTADGKPVTPVVRPE
jgi:hypothetical protein